MSKGQAQKEYNSQNESGARYPSLALFPAPQQEPNGSAREDDAGVEHEKGVTTAHRENRLLIFRKWCGRHPSEAVGVGDQLKGGEADGSE